MADVVRHTNEELQDKINEILAKYHFLASVNPAEYCCIGCVHTGIGKEYGWDAADAWEELQDCRFLLSDE